MALNWSSVKPEHVKKACDLLKGRKSTGRMPSGLVVHHEGLILPAKEVLRLAYRLANGLADDERLIFSSGDATLNRLRKLGFSAERIS